jgi:glycerol-3-phosphate dehydrogenase
MLFLCDFLKICGNLKEIALTPTPAVKGKASRRSIPVEKSGGGV